MKTIYEFEKWTDEQWREDMLNTQRLYKANQRIDTDSEMGVYVNWVYNECRHDKGDLQGHIEISSHFTKSGHAEILEYEFANR